MNRLSSTYKTYNKLFTNAKALDIINTAFTEKSFHSQIQKPKFTTRNDILNE